MFMAAVFAGLIVVIHSLFSEFSEGGTTFWSGIAREIQSVQRDLHRELANAIQAVKAKGMAASWALVSLSFLYGVFHAAGPGHGKVVISTYIFTHESQLRRGLLISLVCSLCQGFTAIAAVTLTAGLLGFTLRQSQGAITGLETLSYGFVSLLGLTLMLSRAGNLWILFRHPISNGRRDLPQILIKQRNKNDEACEGCDHVHGLSHQDLETSSGWKNFAVIVASIGIRPCSGAVLVLLVAFALNLHWAGVGAVLAMSLGTAITVSVLACLSVYARKSALRIASLIPGPNARFKVSLDLAAILGGSVILIVGILMLQAALTVSDHPFR